MKKCGKCGKIKDEEFFNKKGRDKELSSYCKECNKANLKAHYRDNLDRYLKKNERRRSDIRDYLISKKVKCSHCEQSHVACLDFHHEREKDRDLSLVINAGWSFKRIDEELKKCIVLCSNCHRILHWNEKNNMVALR